MFFKVEIFSSCDFAAERLGKKYVYKYELQVPQKPISGGTPNDAFFYKNPQYQVLLDHSKFVDKAKIFQTNVDAVLTYTTTDGTESSVKLFVTKTSDDDLAKGHRGRIFAVNSKNALNSQVMESAYKPGEFTMHCKLPGSKSYTAVVSTYDKSMPLGGTITLEADHAMVFAEIQDEGIGMSKQVFNDLWSCHTAGGCGNFDSFAVNPTYAMKVHQDKRIFFRLM